MKKPSIGRLTWKNVGHSGWCSGENHDLRLNGELMGLVTWRRAEGWRWRAHDDPDRGIVARSLPADDRDSAKAACEAHVRRCLELNAAPDAERERLWAGVEVAETQKRWANAALEQAKDAAATAREQVQAAREALTAYLEARLKGEEQG